MFVNFALIEMLTHLKSDEWVLGGKISEANWGKYDYNFVSKERQWFLSYYTYKHCSRKPQILFKCFFSMLISKFVFEKVFLNKKNKSDWVGPHSSSKKCFNFDHTGLQTRIILWIKNSELWVPKVFFSEHFLLSKHQKSQYRKWGGRVN